jgi:GNAT superfamily N-acetyltransferase
MNTIRTTTPSDLARLTELFNAYREFYGKEADVKGARQFLESRLQNNDSTIFVADNKETLTGFVQLYPLFSSTRMKKLWLLNDLFVDPVFRGQGISVGLIDRAKELCRESGACGMFLETAQSNSIGNQLYPRAGFTLNAEHNFYDWDV